MLQVDPQNRWEIDLLLRHGWMRDPQNNRRLETLLENLFEVLYIIFVLLFALKFTNSLILAI